MERRGQHNIMMIIAVVICRNSCRLISLLCCRVLFTMIIEASAVPSFLNYSCVTGNSPASASITYRTNLNILLSNLTSNTEFDYGFYNSSYGRNNDKVYVIGMCRGDLEPHNCHSCLNDSRVLLPQICQTEEAIGWYDYCMLRYSNRSIFGTVEISPDYYLLNPCSIPATEIDQFTIALRNLMDKLRTAASGDSHRKFSFLSVNISGGGFQNIYGLVQCTPDLSSLQCDYCLAGAFLETPNCCNGKRGGRVIKPSCNVRYEVYPFINYTVDAPKLLSEDQGHGSRLKRLAVIVGVVVPAILVLIFICVYLRVKKKFQTEGFEEIIANESLLFDFDTIRVATNGFSYSNKLGQGGFGAVYKGKLPNGRMIAVKRLSRDSGQGALEFKNEVFLLAKLQHRNLVKLLDFCFERNERLLIYEFVPNKSLDHFIFDPIKKGQLNWISRYKIIEGIARAILYLHEDSRMHIIHRDLKPSNILLDGEMNPKISDFGLARLVVVNQSRENTNRIVGTYGYMAPEYIIYGQFSIKSDVFSFGVLILQIVSGYKHQGADNGENVEELPLSFAWRNWREGTAMNIVDPSLENSSPDEMMRCIHIGLLCVQENPAERPTMSSVVSMLKNYSITLPVPLEPVFTITSRTRIPPAVLDTQESESKQAQGSENEASITEPYPR